MDKIAESREIERVDYEHWVNEYTVTWGNLDARATETEAEIAELDSEINTLTNRIAMAKGEKTEMENRIE